MSGKLCTSQEDAGPARHRAAPAAFLRDRDDRSRGHRLADVDGGIAVLRRADTVLLLRLGDGHSLTLAPGRGPVLADLEPPGLYYSYATGDGGGRVVFVPRSELLRQLG